ncbi:conserved hypothetical protein [Ricinus communis]|uniref:Uncharacterized protein n=1 Tax=Ricinus communis TaxID=3988 RepID=B9SYT9_RICCO|nr:conserved hypothetical protein [Ricinus communis]
MVVVVVATTELRAEIEKTHRRSNNGKNELSLNYQTVRIKFHKQKDEVAVVSSVLISLSCCYRGALLD